MTNKDKWSRIIKNTFLISGLFSLMTIYFFHNKLVNKYILFRYIYGFSTYEGILYCTIVIQTKNKQY